jgi:hypothetical protein
VVSVLLKYSIKLAILKHTNDKSTFVSVPAVAWPAMNDCPHGLRLLEDFINVEEEHSLMNLIDWETAPSDSRLGNACMLMISQTPHVLVIYIII